MMTRMSRRRKRRRIRRRLPTKLRRMTTIWMSGKSSKLRSKMTIKKKMAIRRSMKIPSCLISFSKNLTNLSLNKTMTRIQNSPVRKRMLKMKAITKKRLLEM
jgi:hypothetical protein